MLSTDCLLSLRNGNVLIYRCVVVSFILSLFGKKFFWATLNIINVTFAGDSFVTHEYDRLIL